MRSPFARRATPRTRRCWRARSLALATLVAAVLLPVPVQAHLVTTGLGPLYDGVSHVLLSPDDLLPVLALAFLAGLNGPGAGRFALFLLPLAWAVGGLAALEIGASPLPETFAAASFLVPGILIAADRRLNPAVVSCLAVAVGLWHGWLNGAGIVAAQREAGGLAGIVAAVFVLMALAAAFAVSLRAAWARTVVRVAGSWIAAIGLLMLGWGLSGRL